MNCENKNKSVTGDIIQNINPLSSKKECNDIGKVWKKNCPKCENEQVYTSKYTLKNAISGNKLCNSCRTLERKIIVPVSGWNKSCPTCGQNQSYSCKSALTLSLKENRICNSCRGNSLKTRPSKENWKRICNGCNKEIIYKSVKSYLHCQRHNSKCRKCATTESAKYADRSFMKTNGYREKMSKSCSGKKHSDKTKEKLRISKLEQIKRLGTQHNYNPLACHFINNFGNKYGYNFKHALNGGGKL